MHKMKLWRAVAVTSMVAMMATSMPVLAEEAVEEAAVVATEEVVEAVEEQENIDELVESGIIDVAAPQVKDAYFGLEKKHTLNVKQGEKLSFFVEADDDLSGFSQASVSFRLKTDNGSESIHLYANSDYYYDAQNKSVKVAPGIKVDNETISKTKTAGTYEISYVTVYDYAGNSTTYYKDDRYSDEKMPEAMKDLKIIVEAAGASEVSESDPKVKTMTLSQEVLGPKDTLKVTATVENANNNNRYFYAYFKTEDGDSRSIYLDDYDQDEVWEGEITIGEYSKSDVYAMDYCEFYTGSGWKYYYVSEESKEQYGYAGVLPEAVGKLKFTVKDTLVDKEPPILENLKLATDTVNVPGTLEITPVVREEGSGISYFNIYVKNSDDSSATYVSNNYYSATGKLYLSFDQYEKNGSVKFDYLYVYDNAGNRSEYYVDYDKKTDSWKKSNPNAHAMPEAIAELVIKVVNDDQAEDGSAKEVTTSTIRDSLVEDIKGAADGSEIHVDISGNSVLKKEALAAIKGTNKTLLLNSNTYQWVVKGSDVTTADADWDMYVGLYSTSSDTLRTAMNKTGYISEIYFKSTTLPGKATLRIIPSDYWRQYYGDTNEDLYVYKVENSVASVIAGPLSMSDEKNLEIELNGAVNSYYYMSSGKVNIKTPFSDVDDDKWYADSIAYVYNNGIMTGIKGTTQFQPEATCTREMMITILYRVLGEPSVEGMTAPAFTDCDFSRWYGNAVIWGYNVGLTSGIKDSTGKATTYGVGQAVTRQELATFLCRFANIKGYDITARADLSSFPDVSEVGGFAKDSMAWANAKGIITGKKLDGKQYLSPTAGASRGEVAKMITSFMNNVK